MSADKSMSCAAMAPRIAAIATLLLLTLSAWAAYTVHSVAGDVKLAARGEKIRLKKGMPLQPSDELELSKAGRKTHTETGMIRRHIAYADNSEQPHSAGSAELSEKMIRTLLSALPQGKANVGVAMISDTDTFTINNSSSYPMMSVFKLHQALAVADRLARSGNTLDSMIYIPVTDLDRDTWSPMLNKYGDEDFMISVGELVRYALTASDNNASNLLFKRIVSPEETDRFIRAIAPDTTFRIRRSEEEMKKDHVLSYDNHTTPLSAALLIRKVFTDSIVPAEMQDSIKSWLSAATTGADRLGAPVMNKPDVVFAHKTGSGYRDADGKLMAHNDVGYFRLPDGRSYALAVFIRDFDGTDNEASVLIAEISRIVYERGTVSKGIQP